MKKKKGVVSILFLFILLTHCQKPETYPIEPSVSFQSFEMKDTLDELGNETKLGILTFYMIDGDGNVGLNEWDTVDIYHKDSLFHHNLFITLLEKTNGIFSEVPLAAPHYYRMPFIEPEGQNKTIKGDVTIRLEYALTLFDYDTIKYSFYMVDRDLNISNTDTTPSIAGDFIGKLTE